MLRTLRIGCLAGVFLTALLLAACRPDCSLSLQTKLNVSFWNDSLGRESRPVVRVHGVGNDSILYDSIGVSMLSLPLHDQQSSTDFEIQVFASDTTRSDTTFVLHVEHTPLPQYISPECGCSMFHELHKVSFAGEGTEKSVSVLSNQVTTDAHEVHVQVHL